MKEILWNLFIKTGNLNYYLLLRKIQDEVLENGDNQSRGNNINGN